MHGQALTADHTERFEALVDSMDTKVAFFYLILFRAVKDGIVRANFNARLTSITADFIQNNRPIFSFDQSRSRAYLNARWMGAMIADTG